MNEALEREFEAISSIYDFFKFEHKNNCVYEIFIEPYGDQSSKNNINIKIKISNYQNYPQVPFDTDVKTSENMTLADCQRIKDCITGLIKENSGYELLFVLYSSIIPVLQEINDEKSIKAKHGKNLLKNDFSDDDISLSSEDNESEKNNSKSILDQIQLVDPEERVTYEQFLEWKSKKKFVLLGSEIMQRSFPGEKTGYDFFLTENENI